MNPNAGFLGGAALGAAGGIAAMSVYHRYLYNI